MDGENMHILEENLSILIRESLDDNGDHICVNCSPDIVVQKIKLSNPLEYLRKTYCSDISQDGDGSGKMSIYVRFKNTSEQIVRDFYIHLYRNHLGLYNNPLDWQKYEMKTEDGKPVRISSLGPKEIGVTPAFIYENSEVGEHPNCFVAIATKEKNPDFSSIDNFDKYKKLINKKNVAARNVIVRRSSNRLHNQLLMFCNKENKSVLTGIYVKVQSETLSGTKYGIKNRELEIEDECVFAKGDVKSAYIFSTVIVPAKYSGELLVWSEVPERGKADIQVTYWKIDDQIDCIEQYASVISGLLARNVEMETNDTHTLLGGCRIINMVD